MRSSSRENKDSGLSPLTLQRILFAPSEGELSRRQERTKDGATGLFEDILSRGSILRVRVTGQSMFPFLEHGDIVTIRKASPSSLRLGDLLFFRNQQGLPVLHRLVRKKNLVDGSSVLQTKGDALASMDEPILIKNVLGKVYEVEKGNGSRRLNHINMESRFWKILNYVIALMRPARPFVRRTLNGRLLPR